LVQIKRKLGGLSIIMYDHTGGGTFRLRS